MHSTDLSANCSTLKTLHETVFFKDIIYKTNNKMEIDRGLVAASNSSFVCLFICFLFELNYMCTLFRSLNVLSRAANNPFSIAQLT